MFVHPHGVKSSCYWAEMTVEGRLTLLGREHGDSIMKDSDTPEGLLWDGEGELKREKRNRREKKRE